MTIDQRDADSTMAELLQAPTLSRLAQLADDFAEQYQSAHPFPHIVIDDFLPPEILERALHAYPKPGELDWQSFDNAREKKLAFAEVEALPPAARGVLHFLNTAPVLQFLEKLTGIDGVMPDPYYVGGGLHQIEPGGKLGIHADFNILPKLRVERRLNLLLFMNKDWKDEYGGYLDLWERDMSACVHKVLPVFNRCVIFTISDDAWHGHPDPLTCPEGMTRKSMATYYYTSFTQPEDLADVHTTIFQARKGSEDAASVEMKDRLKAAARAVLPPIFVDTVKSLRGKK